MTNYDSAEANKIVGNLEEAMKLLLTTSGHLAFTNDGDLCDAARDVIKEVKENLEEVFDRNFK